MGRTAQNPVDTDIAIVGAACRLPGATTPEEFWQLLCAGRDMVGPPGEDRWNIGGRGPSRAGYLPRVDLFDPEPFGISPREAAAIDPQQRLMLELAWEAVEDARVAPSTLSGSRTAVIASTIWDDYAELTHERDTANRTHHSFVGTRRTMLANRVSYLMGLTGPSLTIDTGQSSSLVAVRNACETLRRGEASMALVGGVNLMLSSESTWTSHALGALSKQGRCYTFDERADGYVRGEGGVTMLLKPLAQARIDGDRVYCVIRGGAVNNDGRGDTLTAPSQAAQTEVLREALRDSGVAAQDVQYVELHGTGTPSGDPVEAAALGAALTQDRTGEWLRVGSLKTNLGHLEAAAGIAGLLKTALSIHRRRIPASLNYKSANPHIPLPHLRLKVQDDIGHWPRPSSPLVAGVSSFGLGGTNCHLVLSDHDDSIPAVSSEPASASEPAPWVISGSSPRALRQQAARLAAHVSRNPGVNACDIGFSLAATRTAWRYRAAIVASDLSGLADAVEAIASARPHPDVVRGVATEARNPVFVFPGQGTQWRGMGIALARESQVFAETMEECDAALRRYVDWSLWDVLRHGLDHVEEIQPAAWAVMVSLARLWQSYGVTPAAVLGHSQGELAAATFTGALSVSESARIVTLRSQLGARDLMHRGGMTSLKLSAEETRRMLARWNTRLTVAAWNGPSVTVVVGDLDALGELEDHCETQGVRARRVPEAWAGHSADVDAIGDELLAGLGELSAQPGTIPQYSTATTELVAGTDLDADYWLHNLRQPVRFHETIMSMMASGHRHFIEVAPQSVLTPSIHEIAESMGYEVVAHGTLRRDGGDAASFLKSLMEAHVNGISTIEWPRVFPEARVVDLPYYAFQRDSYWLPNALRAKDSAPSTTSPVTPQDVTSTPPPDAVARDSEPRSARLLSLVREHAAAILGYTQPELLLPDTPFKEAGFDSAMAVELRESINSALDTRLPAAVVFSYPTPRALADHLRGEMFSSEQVPASPESLADSDEPIAIVGMACRFPGGVTSPQELWSLVESGTDAIGPFPRNRGWDIATPTDGGYEPERANGSYVDQGGFLHDAAQFDAGFFGISPREAVTMDPQQRLLLETTWEALERTGIVPDRLADTDTGVFVGAMHQEYGSRLDQPPEGLAGQMLTGTTSSVLSGRVAYTFGLRGPAVTVDTACSSSLVSLHMAAQALRQGDCGLALAGGVTVMSNPGMFVEFSRQRGLAPDGRCKAFAAAADGTAWAEGVGVLVLERVSEARRRGHHILALLRGSAINQDGRSNGLTAPSGISQQRVIEQALARAKLKPDEVDVVEAHGTGTKLGDPVEAQALLAAYGRDRDVDHPLYLGSLKSNIGHAQAASGVGGVIKLVMAMRHGWLPRTLHVDAPTSHVDWSSQDMQLLTEPRPWPHRDRPRRGAVSSFGISGTNAHVVLEAPAGFPADNDDDGAAVRVWPLSARTGEALREAARRLREHLHRDTDLTPADVERGLARRSPMPHRAAAIGIDRDSLLGALSSIVEDTVEDSDATVAGFAAESRRPVFVFPGQGAQWSGMGVELARRFPVFADSLRECEAALEPYVDWSLWSVLDSPLTRVDVVQPASWAVMVSLARLWRSFGVQPAAVIGHSQGEIAAATVSGALSLQDAARVVAVRAQVIAERLAGHGGMVSLPLSAGETADKIAGSDVSIAAVNGPSSIVVSGTPESLDALLAACDREGIGGRRVQVDYASHSAQVESVRTILEEHLADIRPRQSEVPFYSTLRAAAVDTTTLDARYWTDNLRHRVRFADTLEALLGDGHRCFIESSPHPVLTAAIRETGESFEDEIVALGTLRRDDDTAERFVHALATGHVHGVDVVLPGSDTSDVIVDLPTYPFQRQRYWLDAPAVADSDHGHPWRLATHQLADGDQVLLTAELPASGESWLADHVVNGTTLLPATAFAELARLAGDTVGHGRICELTLPKPLHLPADGTTPLQVIVSPPEDGSRAVAVYSQSTVDNDVSWTCHATGTLGPDTGDTPPRSGGNWPPEGSEAIDVAGCYDELRILGYQYGPEFQGMTAAWRRGEQVFTEVTLSPEQQDGAGYYGIHPALWDAALHGALLGRDGLALPFGWTGVEVFASGATRLRVTATPVSPDVLAIDMRDSNGVLVAQVDSLELRESSFESSSVESAPCYVPSWSILDTVRDEVPWRLWREELPKETAPYIVVRVEDRDLGETITATFALIRQWLGTDRFSTARLVFAVADETPISAAVVALARAVRVEHPDRFGIAHLPDDLDDRAISLAVSALEHGEFEVRVRGTEVEAARLRRTDTAPLALPARGWRLTPGDDSTPQVQPRVDEPLNAGQVRVAPAACGLNFRDVVVTLAMVPGLEGIGVEGAGTVVETGPAVTGFAVGDRVMGLLSDGMADQAVVDERFLASVPDGMTCTQAAALPVAFLTAWLALAENVQPGDRVLIHAATGGFGSMAIQVAGYLGAEVFATASPVKQHLLRLWGIDDDHIASSRTAEFFDRFGATTKGTGVDVVLNTLAAELTDASLELTRPGGLFIELGKTDVRDPEQVSLEHKGVEYRYFDLLTQPPSAVAAAMSRLPDLLASGQLRVPQLTTMPISRAPEAFDIMRGARHTGKIVLTTARGLSPDRTVLITGGTGTLGALLARHLVTQHGVGHLVLTSRRGMEATGAAELAAELRDLGASVRIAACDASQREELAELLRGIPASHPLGTVVHAAGILDDALAEDMTADKIARVLRAKATAAAHLDALTAEADLEAFVLFSSVASVVGTPAQANYAAANGFLDGLARDRRRRGLPGTSLAWGIWRTASGMTGHLAERDLARMSGNGVAPLESDTGLAMFDAALRADEPVTVAARLDYPALRERAAEGELPPLFRDLVTAPRRRAVSEARVTEEAATLADRLRDSSDEHRQRVIRDLVRDLASRVLRLDSTRELELDATFREVGFESLTAVELRNRLNKATGLSLPSTVVFRHPTPAELADRIVLELFGERQPRIWEDLDRLGATLTDISDEDRAAAARRLRDMLRELDGGHDDIDSASDEEMFSLLDKELGLE